MPATSDRQRKLMGTALGVKRGTTKLASLPQRVQAQVKKLTSSMSEAQLRDFAKRPKTQAVLR